MASVSTLESDCTAGGALSHACKASRTLTASKYSCMFSSAGSHFSRMVSGSFFSYHAFVIPWCSSISSVDCTVVGSAFRPTSVVNRYSIVSLSVYWFGCSCAGQATAASALELMVYSTLAKCQTRVGTVCEVPRESKA